MNKSNKTKLVAAGWRLGTVTEFLELTSKESEAAETNPAQSKEQVDP